MQGSSQRNACDETVASRRRTPELTELVAAGSCPLVMIDGYRRVIDNFPAVLLNTVSPIKVFAIHEERLIEQTDFAHHRRANHHTRPDHRINLSLHIRIEVSQIICSEAAAAREEAGQPEQAVKGNCRSGETAPTGRSSEPSGKSSFGPTTPTVG